MTKLIVVKQVVPVEIRGQRNHIKYIDKLRSISRKNRQTMTKAELGIWLEVLNNKKLDYRFFRQKPLGKFIADFYCAKLALIIEIDGPSHLTKSNTDNSRDLYFEQRGILTIRFTNNEVLHSLELVKSKLREIITKRKSELSI